MAWVMSSYANRQTSGSIVARYRNPDAVANGVVYNEKMKLNIDLYPNPAAEYVYATLNTVTQERYTIQIVDSHGKIMQTFPVQNYFSTQGQKFRLSVSALPAGVYNVRSEGGNARAMKSFVKY